MKLDKVLKLPAIEAAPLLLGWKVCRDTSLGTVKLIIVETEAYHQDDSASHSHGGLTKRTAPMFEAGGRLYIYFIYGMHHSINIVVGKKGIGEAVLLRAGQPLEGIGIMRNNRGVEELKKLASGPGRLAQTLGVKDISLSGKILDKSSIYLEPPDEEIQAKDIITSPRVGITKATNLPWRFYIKGNKYVSKPAKK